MYSYNNTPEWWGGQMILELSEPCEPDWKYISFLPAFLSVSWYHHFCLQAIWMDETNKPSQKSVFQYNVCCYLAPPRGCSFLRADGLIGFRHQKQLVWRFVNSEESRRINVRTITGTALLRALFAPISKIPLNSVPDSRKEWQKLRELLNYQESSMTENLEMIWVHKRDGEFLKLL